MTELVVEVQTNLFSAITLVRAPDGIDLEGFSNYLKKTLGTKVQYHNGSIILPVSFHRVEIQNLYDTYCFEV